MTYTIWKAEGMLILMHMKTIIGSKWSVTNKAVCQGGVASAAVTMLPKRTGALQ